MVRNPGFSCIEPGKVIWFCQFLKSFKAYPRNDSPYDSDTGSSIGIISDHFKTIEIGVIYFIYYIHETLCFKIHVTCKMKHLPILSIIQIPDYYNAGTRIIWTIFMIPCPKWHVLLKIIFQQLFSCFFCRHLVAVYDIVETGVQF